MVEDIYRESFSRNIGIVTEKEQEKLRNAKVAIAGVGGAGGNALYALARMGVGNFAIADPEVYAYTDINRQQGATLDTVGKKKVDVLEGLVKSINRDANIKKYPDGLNGANIEEFLNGADVLLDQVEYFKLDIRKTLFDAAQKKGIYIFFSPAFGFGTTIAIFSPKGPSYAEFFGAMPEKPDLDYMINFGQKLFPVIPLYIDAHAFLGAMKRKRPIPTFAPPVIFAGILNALEAAFYILGKKKPVCVPKIKWFDLLEGKIKIIDTAKHKWSLWTKIRLAWELMSAR